MSITLIIVILTAIVSFSAFNNQKMTDELIFYPPAVSNHNQWYRFWSCALIHADTAHLVFNMIALYSFGQNVEAQFSQLFGSMGPILYIALYLISQFLCLIPTYYKHKDDYYYRSLGASGAVSAVIFAGILLSPLIGIGLIFIPGLHIPGFIFGFIYLAITAYLDKKGGGNMNHSAHMYGALAGVILVLIFGYTLSDNNLLEEFWMQIKAYIS